MKHSKKQAISIIGHFFESQTTTTALPNNLFYPNARPIDMKMFQFFNPKKKKFSYKCSCCGQVYDEMPLCFGGEYPDYYFSVPPEERATRIELAESLCVVDQEHFFHRGRITIPIHDHKEDV